MNYNSPEISLMIGRYCASLRKYNDITAREMAQRLNVPYRKITNFEQGVSNNMHIFISYMSLPGFKRDTFLAAIGYNRVVFNETT